MRHLLAIALLASACVAPTSDDSGGGGGGGMTGGDDGGSAVGDCPGGPTCSPKTPDGLEFSGAVPVDASFPPSSDAGHAHLAIGGTDLIQLREGDAPFDLAFTADVEDGSALAIDSTGPSTVTLRGLGGTTDLDITDPATSLLFDRYAYASSALATAAVVPDSALAELVPSDAAAFAFTPGDLVLGVALVDGETPSHRLVDIGATLAAAGATQTDWDVLWLPGAAVGSYPVTATVGGSSAATTLDVVDHADSIAQSDSGFDDVACFAAETAGGAFIVGLAWTFTLDGAATGASIFGTNCVDLPYDGATHAIVATAGGQSLTISAMAQ